MTEAQRPRIDMVQKNGGPPSHGIARVLSKMGMASRSQAAAWVIAGKVRLNGSVVTDPERPVRPGIDRIEVDGRAPQPAEHWVVVLNKPRGLVTTTHDEKGRATVYRCFEGADLPWIAPIGRLDKASEGLLLFTNDPQWAARLSDPRTAPLKSYHVQVDRLADAALTRRLVAGITSDGERLRARSAALLRTGAKNSWLEITLEEGRNRQIRRMLSALDASVLRLIRVAIGPLQLGELAKGSWRRLGPAEIAMLAAKPGQSN